MRIILLLLSAVLLHAQEYDLVLKGGHVIDPKNKINARRDVAIKDGKIAAVEANIPANKAAKSVNVGRTICHTRARGYSRSRLRRYRNRIYGAVKRAAGRSHLPLRRDYGGRCGLIGLAQLRRFQEVDHRQRANSCAGAAEYRRRGHGRRSRAETEGMDPEKAAEMAGKYKNIIVGFKTAHYAGPEWTPVENAVKAGEKAGLPIMVDFGRFRPERPFEELVTKKLRPGDIYTHLYLSSSADAGRFGQAAALPGRGPQARSHLRCWSRRRQLSYSGRLCRRCSRDSCLTQFRRIFISAA